MGTEGAEFSGLHLLPGVDKIFSCLPAWKGPLQKRQPVRCLHRAAVQVVDLNNLVGYKMMKAPEEFEFNEYLDLLPTDFR